MSHSRVSQLRELQSIIEEISRAIMWVNEREEEELVFDWGDKNIDQYIPRKQESYSVRPNSHFRDGMLRRTLGCWHPQTKFLGSHVSTGADEGLGGERKRAEQAQTKSRWSLEQQPPCFR